jgi:prohibitin 1
LLFSSEFSKSIEQKQIAQQDAERAKFVVTKREEEKKATILRAEGEAEAAELVSKAIEESGRGLVALRKIEAATHIAKALAGSGNITFLTGNAMQIPAFI